jgi:hypothetical protein
MPVDAVTLGAWLVYKSEARGPERADKQVTPGTLKKYLSGIRWQHIANGHKWPFGGDAWLKLVKASVAKEFPTKRFLKVPMSVQLLRALASELPGWPSPTLMAFDDLLWICASTIMVFAALRGGEATRTKGSSRPLLVGRDVILDRSSSTPGVIIRIRKPKTEPGLEFQTGRAYDPEGETALCPSTLLAAYRAKALGKGIPVLDLEPAFKMANGAVLTMDFMLARANVLKRKAGVRILDEQMVDVPFRAASWRAGFVLTARGAGISELQIRDTGRWSSDGGPAPYTFTSKEAFRSASTAMMKATASAVDTKEFQMGAFSSSLAIFEAAEEWGHDDTSN